jgi:hypothetical protein
MSDSSLFEKGLKVRKEVLGLQTDFSPNDDIKAGFGHRLTAAFHVFTGSYSLSVVQDSMDGKTAKSPYDPSVPQTQSYLKGYHDETERRLKAGIKPTDEETQTGRAATQRNEINPHFIQAHQAGVGGQAQV